MSEILHQLISACRLRTVSSSTCWVVTRRRECSTISRGLREMNGMGPSHTSGQIRRSWCSAAEWKVAALTSDATSSWDSLLRISAAALTEKVTASVARGSHALVAHA